MKQKLKQHKGITLIALIITIIVLLILAAVAIAAIKGDGIISHAKNAKSQYSGAQINEQSILQGYIGNLDESQLVSKNIKDNLNTVLSTGGNITLEDDFGNKIKIPAGFKIITKTDTENTDLNYTAEDIDVTKGIVVEDGEGNQFVWIPVGKIYTDAEKTEENAKTITLGRYSNFTKQEDGTYNIGQNAEIVSTKTNVYGCTEDTILNHDSICKNAIAKNIEEFCKKTVASEGYYIGRYEARTETERKTKTDELTPVTLKVNDVVYNYVTQPQASERCKNMYIGMAFESDLVNSYAWDTALIFFQEFGGNATYASKTNSNNFDSLYGTKDDRICNVYDMAASHFEWSTETSNNKYHPEINRGGYVYNSPFYAKNRSQCTNSSGANYEPSKICSFRPILYM